MYDVYLPHQVRHQQHDVGRLGEGQARGQVPDLHVRSTIERNESTKNQEEESRNKFFAIVRTIATYTLVTELLVRNALDGLECGPVHRVAHQLQLAVSNQ
jgi:hypothetical protein